MDSLFRIAVKIPAQRGQDIPPFDFVPVLQRWIQKHTVPGTLIDVADYSHMHHGAGVILVAHEFNISIDYADGRMGLLYNRKQPLDGSVEENIRLCIKYAAMACEELQNEPEFLGKLAFDASCLIVTSNDRLLAGQDEGAEHFIGHVRTVVDPIYEGTPTFVTEQADPRNRVTVEARAGGEVSLKSVIGQCSAQTVS